MKLSKDELAAEIYAVLKKSPHGRDDEVAEWCAYEVMRAEAQKEQGTDERPHLVEMLASESVHTEKGSK